MSVGQSILLNGAPAVLRAQHLLAQAPRGSFVVISPPRRSSSQNRLLWSRLGDISRAKPDGRELSPDLWKCLFMAACGFRVRFEPGIDGEGVVPLGFRSSRLTKEEMSDLLECINEFGARHQIRWSDEPSEQEDAAA